MITGAHVLFYSENPEAEARSASISPGIRRRWASKVRSGIRNAEIVRTGRLCFALLGLPPLLIFGAVSPGSAQPPRAVVHYPLRLVSLSLFADTCYGLQLLVRPAGPTRGDSKPGSLVWLRFDPDSALDWLNRAAAALRLPAPGGPSDAIQWSPLLRPLRGVGGFLLGRHRKKGVLGKERWVAFADSTPGWQAEIDAAEADSLLRLLLALAPLARVDTSAGAALDPDHADRPVKILSQATPRARGVSGQVAVQYVVGTDGLVERESLVVLLASAPRLETETREIILAARFAPAEQAGRPVRQVVRQVLEWR